MSIRLFFDRWPQYNRRLAESIATLTPEQLALRPSPEHWPIWALVGHTAGTRVYWLCHVLGEPGAETTPFGGSDDGWEDDLEQPRSAEELVAALDSSYAIIDGVLDERYATLDILTLDERRFGAQVQIHTRTSILQRLLTHEAYHGGEIAQILGTNGLEPPYIWRAYE
ncbi:MAG: hypothetical protein NVS9B8_18450 [Candidatus Limnocylindrales bacterium]